MVRVTPPSLPLLLNPYPRYMYTAFSIRHSLSSLCPRISCTATLHFSSSEATLLWHSQYLSPLITHNPLLISPHINSSSHLTVHTTSLLTPPLSPPHLSPHTSPLPHTSHRAIALHLHCHANPSTPLAQERLRRPPSFATQRLRPSLLHLRRLLHVLQAGSVGGAGAAGRVGVRSVPVRRFPIGSTGQSAAISHPLHPPTELARGLSERPEIVHRTAPQ